MHDGFFTIFICGRYEKPMEEKKKMEKYDDDDDDAEENDADKNTRIIDSAKFFENQSLLPHSKSTYENS